MWGRWGKESRGKRRRKRGQKKGGRVGRNATAQAMNYAIFTQIQIDDTFRSKSALRSLLLLLKDVELGPEMSVHEGPYDAACDIPDILGVVPGMFSPHVRPGDNGSTGSFLLASSPLHLRPFWQGWRNRPCRGSFRRFRISSLTVSSEGCLPRAPHMSGIVAFPVLLLWTAVIAVPRMLRPWL